MEGNEREKLFREMASRYAEQYGRELLEERTALEERRQPDTARLDWKVRKALRGDRARRRTRWAGALAACMLLVMMVPVLLRQPQMRDGAAGSAAGDMAGGEQAAGEEREPAAGAGEVEILPLTFALPENFSVAGVEPDNGSTVYYLADAWGDDVVMTMRPGESDIEYAALTPIRLGEDMVVHGAERADYSLLAFERDGVAYTLTCRYDINTLAALGRRILG